MIKTDKPDGGYVLTADVGKDLVVMDGETVTVNGVPYAPAGGGK